MSAKRFRKGDFAFTTHSLAPSVNNGHLVIVRAVHGPMPGAGLDFAYLIERVDGESFAIACIPGTRLPGRPQQQVYADQRQLRPLGGVPRWKARRARGRRQLQAA